jgi:hypothetical protein
VNVNEFKTWFRGLTAGMTEGQAMSWAQVKALKEAVAELTDSKDEDTSPPKANAEPGPVPAQSPTPVFTGDWEKILDKNPEKGYPYGRTPPFGGPYRDPYRDPNVWPYKRPTHLKDIFGDWEPPATLSVNRGH